MRIDARQNARLGNNHGSCADDGAKALGLVISPGRTGVDRSGNRRQLGDSHSGQHGRADDCAGGASQAALAVLRSNGHVRFGVWSVHYVPAGAESGQRAAETDSAAGMEEEGNGFFQEMALLGNCGTRDPASSDPSCAIRLSGRRNGLSDEAFCRCDDAGAGIPVWTAGVLREFVRKENHIRVFAVWLANSVWPDRICRAERGDWICHQPPRERQSKSKGCLTSLLHEISGPLAELDIVDGV